MAIPDHPACIVCIKAFYNPEKADSMKDAQVKTKGLFQCLPPGFYILAVYGVNQIKPKILKSCISGGFNGLYCLFCCMASSEKF